MGGTYGEPSRAFQHDGRPIVERDFHQTGVQLNGLSSMEARAEPNAPGLLAPQAFPSRCDLCRRHSQRRVFGLWCLARRNDCIGRAIGRIARPAGDKDQPAQTGRDGRQSAVNLKAL